MDDEPMHPLIAAAIAARRATGLSVRTTMGGRSAEQHFDTPAARDEYMTRARRAGATVEILDTKEPAR